MNEILMFHRVLPNSKINKNDAYFLRGTLISEKRLENLIVDYLNRGYSFKTIIDFEHSKSNKQVTLTFDDGYLDNYLYAKPILDKYNVKATFYPVVGYCINQTKAPLDYYYYYVNTKIDKEKEDWIKGKTKKEFIKLPINKQSSYVLQLFNNALPEINVSYMSITHLKELYSHGHEIGGHSYYHDIYNRLNKNEIYKDIHETITAFLRVNINIKSYAYTDGQYNADVIEMLLQKNIKKSCAIVSQHLSKNKNLELERRFVTENEII